MVLNLFIRTNINIIYVIMMIFLSLFLYARSNILNDRQFWSVNDTWEEDDGYRPGVLL